MSLTRIITKLGAIFAASKLTRISTPRSVPTWKWKPRKIWRVA